MKVFQLIYVSLAAEDFQSDALFEMRQRSRAKNERAGITGMLLYKERRFMQLLEGKEAAVRATYKVILKDPRHREVTTLLKVDTSMRDFEEWSMGFQNLQDESARRTPGFSSFLEVTLSVFHFSSDPSRAHQLLRIFRRL